MRGTCVAAMDFLCFNVLPLTNKAVVKSQICAHGRVLGRVPAWAFAPALVELGEWLGRDHERLACNAECIRIVFDVLRLLIVGGCCKPRRPRTRDPYRLMASGPSPQLMWSWGNGWDEVVIVIWVIYFHLSHSGPIAYVLN